MCSWRLFGFSMSLVQEYLWALVMQLGKNFWPVVVY